MYSTGYSCHIVIKLESSRKIFRKIIKNIKLHENPTDESGRKDMSILTFAVRTCANSPKRFSFVTNVSPNYRPIWSPILQLLDTQLQAERFTEYCGEEKFWARLLHCIVKTVRSQVAQLYCKDRPNWDRLLNCIVKTALPKPGCSFYIVKTALTEPGCSIVL